MGEKTHWKKLMNPNYLGAYEFQPGEEKIVKIASVRKETVVGTEGKKEECTVMYFSEPQGLKPLILNVTNQKAIEKACGSPWIEDWIGQMIQLYVAQVKAFGDVVDAVRVRGRKVRAAAAQVYQCESCGKAVQGFGSKNAGQMAAYTKKNYGQVLCAECAMKRKQEAENENHENQN